MNGNGATQPPSPKQQVLVEDEESSSSVAVLTVLNCKSLRCVDLSWTYDASTIYWPGGEGFNLCVSTFENDETGDFYAAGVFSSAEHGGTHVDAPYHFAKQGRTVDRMRLRDLIAPCFVIDIPQPSSADYIVTSDDILSFEGAHALTLPEGCIVVIRTGWAERWQCGAKSYLGFDEKSDGKYETETSPLSFPGLGADAARLLVDRKVAGVGVDTASIDAGSSKDFIVHKILLGNDIYGIENLSQRVRDLPAIGATLFVMPTKLAGGSGAPARVVALFP